MHSTPLDNETRPAAPQPSSRRTRLVGIFTLLLVLVLIAVLPPLVNVSRFQKRIAANISTALGRPVHFDRVALTLVPLPGFTLENFVIDEDPAFGYEPILRAGQVQVTLRIASFLHPHLEFSKIAFSAGDPDIAPSLNLVHAANGQWNVERLLLQASHLQAAPTAQRFAGPDRRFPYIEATGARVNLKLGQDKSPVSLTDADFALWLPEPHQWHLRLEAHPIRTDTAPGDTGTIRAEGTLGGADLNAASLAQIPINLHGDWRDAQLGGLSRLLLGYDPGLRGDISLSFTIAGTVGRNAIATDIQIAKARRADFVPDRLLSLEAACTTTAAATFHSFTEIQCNWPPADSSGPSVLILTASVPDVSRLATAAASLTLPALPADTLFDWLSVATPHPPTVLEGAGSLAGTLAWGAPSPVMAHPQTAAVIPGPLPLPAAPALSGELELSGTSIALNSADNRSIPLGDVILRSTPPIAPPPARSRTLVPLPAPAPDSFNLLPVSLALGGKQPAILEGHCDAGGYSLHLSGTVLYSRLIELAVAVPQFGDGLPALLRQLAQSPRDTSSTPASASSSATAAATTELPLPTAPVHIDLTATRAWGGPQTWTQITPAPVARRRLHR